MIISSFSGSTSSRLIILNTLLLLQVGYLIIDLDCTILRTCDQNLNFLRLLLLNLRIFYFESEEFNIVDCSVVGLDLIKLNALLPVPYNDFPILAGCGQVLIALADV
jgi:hypothetical protein